MHRVQVIVIATVAVGFILLSAPVRAEEPLILKDMAYIAHGASVMGVDKEAPADSGKKPTPYDRRMKAPWSAEAFRDEGPEHMVFLDAYLMDTYEVSNKDYGHFVKANGHPAPAYWDDPNLNKAQQPVVGVNWKDATAFCEYRGKRLPTEAEWEKAARWSQCQPLPLGERLRSSQSQLWQESRCDHAGGFLSGGSQLLRPVQHGRQCFRVGR